MMTICIKFTKASQKTVRNLNHWATFPALLRKSRTIYIPYFFSESFVKSLFLGYKCHASSNCLPLTLSLPYSALLMRAFKSQAKGTIEV